MDKKKLLITGSGGFLISNFIRYALYNKAPYKFVSIDKVRENLVYHNVYINKDHEFHIGDVTDEHFINVIFQITEPDIVIHAAAETSVDESINDPVPFIDNNILGTQIIADACAEWGVQRLVYLSTDQVYGQLESESEPSWTEQSPLSPRNTYSASKAASEMLIKAKNNTHGLKYNILRLCNNYGSRQLSNKLIPKIIKKILNNEKMPIYGQGMQIRDWMYIDDTSEAILKILSDGYENNIYNISASQELPNIEVFQRVCNTLGKGYDLIEFVDDRLGHDFRYSVDNSKIKSLNWTPKFKFNDGIKETVKWYMMNQWVFRK